MPTTIITPKPTPVGFTVRTQQYAASHSESALIADFGSIPPEVNSARMYTGAGADPLLKAAAMWDALSADLYAAAGSHHAIAAELTTESWLGAASENMMGATTPHLVWLHDTAALAARTAQHARAAVAAYEAARAMTVPPSVVAANRAQLATMAAANTIGLNSHAIADIDAQYREMWAQDSAAMYMYADTSATAADVPPFLPPPGGVGDVAGMTTPPIVLALRRLASPARMRVSTTGPLTGALAFMKPIGPATTGTVRRVAATASVGEAAAVGALSAPRGWFTTKPAVPVTWGVTPIDATPTVPMMPVARTMSPVFGNHVPAPRPGVLTVISMKSGV